jgi:two-component system sensor histidine kinase/response regulator
MKLDGPTILKAIFESTADGLLIVGNDGKVIDYNHRFAELWKIPAELLETKDDDKLLGYILGQLIDPKNYISKVKELYKNYEAESNDTVEFLDGRFFERYSRPLKVEGETMARVWSFRDVTEHKKSQEFFSTITDLSPDIVSLIDESGKVVFNSTAAERIHGYTQEEMIGRNTFEFIHKEDQANVASAMAQLLADPQSILSIQYRFLNKNGTWSWMEATASNQIKNPLIRGMVTISREIGKRKQLEADLNRAIQERDEFISISSHELKTPITSVLLQLQMLQRYKIQLRPDGAESKKRFEDLDGLVDQIQSIQRLIDDLLSVSRIRTGKLSMEFSVEDFSTLLRLTLKRFNELFLEAGCSLKVNIEEGINVSCDKTRISQVFFNLMTNAAKYAPGTLIEINLKSAMGYAEFTIRDHGQGIPEDKKDFIFGLFERGTSQNYVTGLGIGLYISRSIVEGHKGTIDIESESGKGATFCIRLPLASTN